MGLVGSTPLRCGNHDVLVLYEYMRLNAVPAGRHPIRDCCGRPSLSVLTLCAAGSAYRMEATNAYGRGISPVGAVATGGCLGDRASGTLGLKARDEP
jgi:hypothetical protein